MIYITVMLCLKKLKMSICTINISLMYTEIPTFGKITKITFGGTFEIKNQVF